MGPTGDDEHPADHAVTLPSIQRLRARSGAVAHARRQIDEDLKAARVLSGFLPCRLFGARDQPLSLRSATVRSSALLPALGRRGEPINLLG
jgi:hypothetical protein